MIASRHTFITIPILLISLVFNGCKKETIIYPSPEIKIESVSPSSLTSFQIVINSNKGEGQTINSAKIILKDITIITDSIYELEIPIRSNINQTDTILFKDTKPYHDYSIQGFLKTDLYTYDSDIYTYRSNKNVFTLHLDGFDELAFLKPNVSRYLNRGQNFGFSISYQEKYNPSSIKLFLNDSIELEHTASFDKLTYGSDGIYCYGGASIPNNIAPGIYRLSVIIDNRKVEAINKLEVLKGNWSTINVNYPGEERGEYAWFMSADCLYIVGGFIYNTSSSISPTWKFSFTEEKWSQLGNFPHDTELIECQLWGNNLKYGDKSYVIFSNDTGIDIYEYLEKTDTWKEIATYPGKGKTKLTYFICDGTLYVGGGVEFVRYELESTEHYDFWALDLETNEWTQRKDMPIKHYNDWGNTTCTTENGRVFTFSFANELWEYNTGLDIWIELASFPGHERFDTKLISNNGHLYLLGGSYTNYGLYGLNDCWEYSIENNEWNLCSFLPEYCSRGVAFKYLNNVYIGLGWVQAGYRTILEKNIYKLSF